MKRSIVFFFIVLVLSAGVQAQQPKKHYSKTISGTLHGAKFGPVGAAGGFVVGRVLDKRKEKKEKEGKSSEGFVKKHVPFLKGKNKDQKDSASQ